MDERMVVSKNKMSMEKEHHYDILVKWTGNQGTGTSGYRTYDRSHLISSGHKSGILGSADPAFRGDGTKYNPEELLVAAVSACHMLWYLHLCADAKIVVLDYSDNAEGLMTEDAGGSGIFEKVSLHPKVLVAEESMIDQALALHKKANSLCFIANALKIPVYHYAECKAQGMLD